MTYVAAYPPGGDAKARSDIPSKRDVPDAPVATWVVTNRQPFSGKPKLRNGPRPPLRAWACLTGGRMMNPEEQPTRGMTERAGKPAGSTRRGMEGGKKTERGAASTIAIACAFFEGATHGQAARSGGLRIVGILSHGTVTYE